ncbi:MAG: hypothetical protein NC311_12635 [Muribaculaceae bacterium]|nr:hypothetical protein [Muribaculaceae bacterium]
MKHLKYFSKLTTILSIVILSSCSSYTDLSVESNQSNESMPEVSIVPLYEMEKICNNVVSLCDANDEATRAFQGEANHLSESTAASIQRTVQPLTESGKSYIDAIIISYQAALESNSILQENLLSEEELEILNDLSEEELTFVGMQLSILSDVYENAVLDDDVELQISLDKFMNDPHVVCFIKAIGLDSAGGLIEGMAQLIEGNGNIFKNLISAEAYLNAKTMSQLLKAMGVKYLGWIGVGVMIYDYYQCINH